MKAMRPAATDIMGVRMRRNGNGRLAYFKRFPDGCYALLEGDHRGPCAHDKPTALKRFQRSGFVARAKDGA